ncbi:MAG TPA: DUF488 domain-containing protein [Candidatus Sulfotelmatobacter sp.]|nr:DUF488 domain-containing protein [Candidatus Sulfotelmatobacter sp.]
MKIFTIGFTKKSAREFFGKLRRPGLSRLIDVRLNNVSQLAGFSKRDDLSFFCESILSIQYLHLPELAPTQEMLDGFKKNGGDWGQYEAKFLALMAERRVEENLDRAMIDGGCLLCSESTPEHCHRRLIAEYLNEKWGDVEVEHIL